MIGGDDRWFTVASALLNGVQAKLTTPVARACVVNGAIAWDAADCAALYTAWSQIYLSDEFPHPAEQPMGNCAQALEVGEFTVQVVRCAPSGSGTAPVRGADCGSLSAAALLMAVDAQQALAGVQLALCTLLGEEEIEDYLVGTITPVGPEGAATAVELHVLVALING